MKRELKRLANTVGKGQPICVGGRVQTRSYDNQQGQKVFVTEVVAERFNYLEKRDENLNNSGQQNQSNNQQNLDRSNDPFSGSSIDISDDVLPFV